MNVQLVGRVIELMRFPVKSMAGEQCAHVDVDWQGIEGDRQYGFYRTEDRTRFPWLTAREVPDLLLLSPAYRDSANPRTSEVEVSLPDGRCIDLQDPALRSQLSEAAGLEIGLIQSGRGVPDAMPISIATTRTHDLLDAAFGAPLDRRRFRSNIVIESDSAVSEWCGRRLAFGEGLSSAQLFLTDQIPRCAMITIDPDTTERDPAIMRMVAQRFDNKVGVYASPAVCGRIQEGDPVYLTG